MSYRYYPAVRSVDRSAFGVVPRSTLYMAGVGAIVGGTSAVAKNIRRVRDSQISREDAVKDTMKEAAGAGLATAAAAAVVRSVGATGLLSLAGVLVVATSAKYFIDSVVGPEKSPVP